jgi:hypothetical protein
MDLRGCKTTKQGLLGSLLAAHGISLGVFHEFSDSLWKRNSQKFAVQSANGNPDPVSLSRGTYSTQIPGTATFFTRWGDAAALCG